MSRAFNFSPGPAALPEAVLEQAREELLEWRDERASVMEISHRGKAFEAMAAQRPIILGVRGEAARIVADAECGLTFTPGDAAGLAESVLALANDPARRKRLGENGYQLAVSKYDRQKLATEYVDLLAKTINGH